MGTIQIDGSTPKLTIGNATAEDATILFDGNAQDFYIALDDSADDLIIGLGSTVGTTPAISINEDRDVTISDGAIDFDIASHDTSNGLKLGGTLVTATAAELNIMDGVTATAAEINLIDGGTARGTTAIADGDGVLINDAGTMRMTTVQTLATYIGGADPSSADGDSLGTASLEWSDLYLADGSIIYMGADQDVTIQHNHNGGLTMKNSYGDTEGFGLHLQTAETTVVATNPIGFITFAAPNEASGTDAVLACAKIQAIAEGTFAADNNATSLQFMTGASEAATEKMRINSAGNLLVNCTATPSGSVTGVAIMNNEEILIADSGTSANQLVRFYNANGQVGNITTDSSATSFNTSSDYRLKENETSITDGIDRIKQLKPYRFNFKADATKTLDGFFAHEVLDIVPEAISGEKDAMKMEGYIVTPEVLNDEGNVVTEAVMGEKEVIDAQGIDQSKLVPLLTSALQEAITKIETLETKVTALEG